MAEEEDGPWKTSRSPIDNKADRSGFAGNKVRTNLVDELSKHVDYTFRPLSGHDPAVWAKFPGTHCARQRGVRVPVANRCRTMSM